MKNLCRAIICSACFFELSEGDVVDPDSAVRALEDIAGSLREATTEERAAFAAACAEEAARLEHEAGGSYEKVVQFIRELPRSLGLEEDSE